VLAGARPSPAIGSDQIISVSDLDRSKEFYPRQNQHQSALDLRPGAAYRRVTEGLDVKAGTGLACRPAVLLM